MGETVKALNGVEPQDETERAKPVRLRAPRQRVLIADDHPHFTGAVKRWFELDSPGSSLDAVHDAEQALAAILDGRHDLVLLDWHFPGRVSGLDICARARAAGCTTPIIMLTVEDDEDQIARALNAGATDYLIKTELSARELCHRIRVWSRTERRTPLPEALGPAYTMGTLVIIPKAQTTWVGPDPVRLGRSQQALLGCLARARGQVVPRDELCAHAGIAADARFRKLHDAIRRLRAQLGPEGKRVETIYEVGYRLV